MAVLAKLLTALIGIARSLGHAAGYRTAVVLEDQRVDVKLIHLDEDAIAWDPGHYLYTNLFLSGYANPVKPEVDESDVSLVPSERYKRYMDQHLLSEMIGEGRSLRAVIAALLAIGGLEALVLIAVIGRYFV